MNSDAPDAPDDLPANPAPETTEAPKKRTRTRKPAVAVEAAEPAPEVTAAPEVAEPVVAEEAAAPARAPRKPRAPRKTAAAVADEAVAQVPVAEAATVAEAAPVAAPAGVEASSPVVAAVGGDVAASAPSGEESVASEGEASAEAESVAERGRNRRRGRRGAGRAEAGADQAQAAPGEVQAVESDSEGEAAGAGLPVAAPSAVDAGEVFASLLSGEFDAEPEAEAPFEGEALAEKRVLLPDADAPKLHKVLAQSGIGSRRDMEQMIQEGRVEVNGEVAHTGMRISFGDRISIEGKPVRVRIAPPPPRVIAYHKPVGEVVTHDDPQQRPTVFRKLPRLQQGKWQSVGRLDINTEGLLLFTNSGDLANKLMHPRFGVEREYAVRVLGTLEKPAKDRLLAGVEIEGQTAAFKSIEEGGGEGVNRWYRVVISEGRNREVRKLFDAVGLAVSRLIRVRYGCVVLPRGLKRGACVDLGEMDVKALRQLTGGQQGQSQGAPRGDAGRPEKREGRRDGPQDGRRGEPRQGARGEGRQEPRGEPRQEPRGENRGQQDRRDGRPARGGPGQQQGGRRDEARADGPRGRNNNPGPNANRRDQGEPMLPRDDREPGDPSRIPNPLQQTYDKRAIQRERAGSREHDFENGPIPNPLQQTYDKRFVQNTGRGPGQGRNGKGGKGGGGGGQGQPDPMQTSVGYIGADAFTRKMQGRGNGGGGGGGGRRGGR
ncbi:pseudouridine synthase [Ideonella azotifigens]|uniref:Pseudouridine synthase n=1 Tax=Ideonella azotifigens TaxID=513160 RepID=A0ABP3VD42_9BURK|nr:pseudouridine synthase [Ideonella azotifigens]MCD2343911.1 pseudouridine synthase [Ideonella azotifigens]